MSLLLPLICLLLFGTIDLARYIRATVELNHAAQVGVRTALNTYHQDSSHITSSEVTTAIQEADPVATVVSVPSGNIVPESQYTVVLTTKFGMITPFVANLKGIQSITVASTGTTLP